MVKFVAAEPAVTVTAVGNMIALVFPLIPTLALAGTAPLNVTVQVVLPPRDRLLDYTAARSARDCGSR